MVPRVSLETQFDLVRGRRLLRKMPPDLLLAHSEMLLNSAVNNGVIIGQAIRHICELEAMEAVRDPAPGLIPQDWGAGVLGGLG